MLKTFKTYQLSLEFNRQSQTLCLPSHLKNQLNRAAASIVLNLAEGYGRFSKADQRRFFIIAMGSLRECQAVLDLVPSCPVQCLELADKLAAHIYKLIRAMG